MNLTDKVQLLKSFTLFNNLSSEGLTVIAEVSNEHTFPAGTIFIEQEDDSTSAYFIFKGGSRVFRVTEDGSEVTLAILGAGDVVGELALLDNSPRSACVEAIQETKVLVITRQNFTKILVDNPETAVSLLCTLADRVRKTNEHLEDVISKNLFDRTWKTLQSLSKYFPGGMITLSQEELACIIGATRSRVTEVLNQLKDDGKLSISHRKIHLT